MRRWLALACAVLLFPGCASDDAPVVGAKATDVEALRCAGCHTREYRQAPHHEGERPMACATCHSEAHWTPTHLDHEWKLQGAHRKAKCVACHTGAPPAFAGTPKACDACHEDDRVRANRAHPSHEDLGNKCADCHGAIDWQPLRRDHGSVDAGLAIDPAKPLDAGSSDASDGGSQHAVPYATQRHQRTPPTTTTAPLRPPPVTTPTATALPSATATATATATPPPELPVDEPEVITGPSRRHR